MNDPQPNHIGIYDSTTDREALTRGLLAGMLMRLTEQYRRVVPAADWSPAHQAEWLANELATTELGEIGYHQVVRPMSTVQPRIEYGMQIPNHHVIACNDRQHAEDVTENSTDGGHVVQRTVGPWEPTQ